jgi:hypothetical protein
MRIQSRHMDLDFALTDMDLKVESLLDISSKESLMESVYGLDQ